MVLPVLKRVPRYIELKLSALNSNHKMIVKNFVYLSLKIGCRLRFALCKVQRCIQQKTEYSPTRFLFGNFT